VPSPDSLESFSNRPSALALVNRQRSTSPAPSMRGDPDLPALGREHSQRSLHALLGDQDYDFLVGAPLASVQSSHSMHPHQARGTPAPLSPGLGGGGAFLGVGMSLNALNSLPLRVPAASAAMSSASLRGSPRQTFGSGSGPHGRTPPHGSGSFYHEQKQAEWEAVRQQQ